MVALTCIFHLDYVATMLLADFANDPELASRLKTKERGNNRTVTIGELGPVIIVDPADTANAIEQAAGVELSGDPTWESCILDHGWSEVVFVTSDDGSGAVILIPDRDDVDPALQAIIRTHAVDVPTTTFPDHSPPAEQVI